MGFSELQAGTFIEVQGKKGQVAWVNELKVLQYGWLIETLEVCLFVPKSGQYEVFVLSEVRTKWDDDYLFSVENIGRDGR